MKVLQFTIPVPYDKTVIMKDEMLPHFYPYLHRHDEIQLTYIIKGEGTLLVGNNMHPFTSNEVYLIGANLPHVFKSDPSYFSNKGNKKVQSLTIFFSTKGKLSSLFELPELKSIHTFFSNFYSSFKISENSFSEISGKMLSIKYSNGLDQLMQFFQLLKSLSGLQNVIPLSPDVKPHSFSDFEGIRISKIYSYIMEHYNRDITLEEVAAVAYMTPQGFCRYFKKHTHHTFVSFLNEVRINEACKKLLEGDFDSMTSIAYDCGFNCVTNFNRVFKSTTGKSPRDYSRDFMKNLSSGAAPNYAN